MREVQRHRALIRFALIYLAVTIGVVAAWILIAPKGFYDTFPGGGTQVNGRLAAVRADLQDRPGAGVAGRGLVQRQALLRRHEAPGRLGRPGELGIHPAAPSPVVWRQRARMPRCGRRTSRPGAGPGG